MHRFHFGKSILKKTYRFNLFLAISELLFGHKKNSSKVYNIYPNARTRSKKVGTSQALSVGYFRISNDERNIFKCCRRDARAAEERCAVIWKHLSPRFRINAVEKLSGWKATGGARVLVSRSGRGGCVTLVWVLTGHRGGRRAEQGRRRQLAVEEEEEEAAASIANSTPSTHRPAFTLTFLWKARAHHSPAHFGKQ